MAKAKWVYSLVAYDYSWDEDVLFNDTPHYLITKGYVLNNIIVVKNDDNNMAMLSNLTESERNEYLSQYTDMVANNINEIIIKKERRKVCLL